MTIRELLDDLGLTRPTDFRPDFDKAIRSGLEELRSLRPDTELASGRTFASRRAREEFAARAS